LIHHSSFTINHSKKMPTKQQIIAYKTLLRQSDCKDNEADLLSAYNVKSCKDLSQPDIRELIDWLSKRCKPLDVAPDLRKARSKVLSQLQSMGYACQGNDWSRVNEYLALPRIAGKRMYDMDEEELVVLFRKLKAIQRKQQEEETAQAYLRENN
jgi:hypothetical protein